MARTDRPGRWADSHRRRRDEGGALTPAVIVMAVGLLLLGGLVTDGGRQLNAKLQAESTAEEAARAGANMLDLREKQAVLDHEMATAAVDEYCEVARSNDSRIDICEVDDFGRDGNKETDWVSVRVTMNVKALLFGIIGQNELQVDVTARSSPVQAVLDPYNDVNLNPFSPTPDYPSLPVPTADDTPLPTAVPIPTVTSPPVPTVTSPSRPTDRPPPIPTDTTPPPPPPAGTTIQTTISSTNPTQVQPSPPATP